MALTIEEITLKTSRDVPNSYNDVPNYILTEVLRMFLGNFFANYKRWVEDVAN